MSRSASHWEYIKLTCDRVHPNSSMVPVLLLLLCALFLLLLTHARLRRRRGGVARAPPGPFPWPVIGNAAQLGSAPHLSLTRMAQAYGSVFRIRLGCRDVVVLNGSAIRSALLHRAVHFAGRPDFSSFRLVSDGRSMPFGGYSEWWKLHRKVAQATVRDFSTSNMTTKRTFQQHVLGEFREVLHLFLHKTRQLGHFQPHQLLVVSIANIMSAICFGKRYAYDDVEFMGIVGRNDQFARTVGAGSIVDVMPWLQLFPNPIRTMFANFKKLNKAFYDFSQEKVREHRQSIQPGVIRDMTDAFILAMDKGLRGPSGVFLDKEYVPPIVNDIFGASQDTLSSCLQWIILLLVRYPDVQSRLYEEVDRVVGRSRLPCIEDQPRLPYVMAFIFEVMRFTSFLPLTIPHSTTTDTTIQGYHIPKDSVVFINQWSVNHDPERWAQPELFDPERFLLPCGELNKDLTSSVLIFSLGRRRCIGEDLSKMLLFLYTTLLVHQCRISADPAHPPSMDHIYGLTLKPKAYAVAIKHRDSMDLLDSVAGQPADTSQ